MATKAGDGVGSLIPANWADVPTYFVDGHIGSSVAGGIHRVVLGSVTFNSDTGATTPTYKPVCELVFTTEVARELSTYLSSLPGVSNDA